MRTVFVIDDDHLMREVLSRVLEKGGFRVRGFHSPLHALPLMDSAYPDAVVSDVQMPGMNGFDLAREVRRRSLPVPVILVTADSTPDVEERARELAVSEVFKKPIRDGARFVAAVDLAVSRREDVDRKAGLDRLRMSFLAGLAHELRTPLTAMKLALDSLFAAHAAESPPSEPVSAAVGGMHSTEGRLLAIGQRNLDRIIRLVEGQLDLLQITLGDVSVTRRLVSIRDLVERAVADAQPLVRKAVEIGPVAGDDRIFVFTDPDRLRTAIRHLLESGPDDPQRAVRVACAVADDDRTVEIRLQNVRVPIGRADTFESRAFHRIIASLCGEIQSSAPEAEPTVTLRIPVLPRFDAREDSTAPLTSLREAAMLSGRSVAVLRCTVVQRERGGSRFSPREKSFFQRAAAVLSEGDALIRGRSEGVYDLILVDRGAEEVARVMEFLRAAGENGAQADLTVEVEETAPHTSRGATQEAGLKAVVEEAAPVR